MNPFDGNSGAPLVERPAIHTVVLRRDDGSARAWDKLTLVGYEKMCRQLKDEFGYEFVSEMEMGSGARIAVFLAY